MSRFLTDVTVGGEKGKRHEYLAAGLSGGLMFKVYLSGQQAMTFPDSNEDKIDYLFAIPVGTEIVDFKWKEFQPITITLEE